MMLRTTRAVTAMSLVLGLAALAGCTRTIPGKDPTGQIFPSVIGESLQQEQVELPGALAGAPAVVLIGYKQRAQFDIDRWLMGLLQSDADVRIVELPTMPGLAASLASGWIDDGMRSGIPREDWGVVVTLYGDAAKPVAEFTGTAEGQLARVLLLDATGRVAWFDDSGYSVRKALEVASLVNKLNGS